jgi:DNA-binding MarR family transcriptional regulator
LSIPGGNPVATPDSSDVSAAVVQYQERMAAAFAAILPGRDLGATVAVWRLTRASSLAERLLETAVHRPRGRTWASYRVLLSIRAIGPTEPGTLAEILDIAPPSVSSLLATLERANLITRRPDPSNRRRVIVELTEAGTKAVDESIGHQTDGEVSFLAGLDASEIETLSAILDKLLMHQWGASRRAKPNAR